MINNIIKDSNIFVTGGAGFVGSYVVEELLKYSPKKIYIVDNLFRGSYKNMDNFIKNPRVEFKQTDIRKRVIIDYYMSRSDYCFHLAALRINACAADPVAGYEVMIKATFDIIESAKKFKIKKIIYSSSASVYGLANKFPTPETASPYKNKTFYGAAKLFGEQLLRSYHYMYGLDYIALRYFNIYGPRMDTDGKYTEVMIKWLRAITSKTNPVIMGNGLATMDFIYVGDVARANIIALQSNISDEVFNIGNQKEISLKDLLSMLVAVNKSNLAPVFSHESKINPVNRRLADISKAIKLLGFKPRIELKEGLRLLSNWYKKNDKYC